MPQNSEPKDAELKNDNSRARATAKNFDINQRNKHIDIKFNLIRNFREQKRDNLEKYLLA